MKRSLVTNKGETAKLTAIPAAGPPETEPTSSGNAAGMAGDDAALAARQDPICEYCGRPAACLGYYEGGDEAYACDECCEHGCEDGRCWPVAGCDMSRRPTSAPAATADLLADVVIDPPLRFDGHGNFDDEPKEPGASETQTRLVLMARPKAAECARKHGGVCHRVVCECMHIEQTVGYEAPRRPSPVPIAKTTVRDLARAVIALTEERDALKAEIERGADQAAAFYRRTVEELRAERDAAIAERNDLREALNEKRARQPIWDEIDRIGGELKDIHNGELHRTKAALTAAQARIAELTEALRPFAKAAEDPVRVEGSDWPVRYLRGADWDRAREALAGGEKG